jgi:hypothetical protein
MSEKIYHISGHLNVSDEEFAEHYAGRIRAAVEEGAGFVVGDARGADQKGLALLWELLPGSDRVTVFHMFGKPRNNPGFQTKGGYTSDDERDAACTAASTHDIAWVRPGRETSGTAKNLARRLAKNHNDRRPLHNSPPGSCDKGCTYL